jgi:predicted transcriptional regulator
MLAAGNAYILKKRLKLFPESRRKAARAAGISDPQLLVIEKGTKGGLNPCTNTLKKICNGWKMRNEYGYVLLLFNHLNKEDLFGTLRGGNENNTGIRKLEVREYVAVGNFDKAPVVDTVLSTQKDEEAFALKIMEKSMAPIFKEGQIIVVSPSTKKKDGDYVVIFDQKNKTVSINKYSKISKNLYLLKALNEESQDIILDQNFHKRHKIKGVVVETFLKYR